MKKLNYLPSISIELFHKALDTMEKGESCNTIMLCSASFEAFINEYLEFCLKIMEQDKNSREELSKNKGIFTQAIDSFNSCEKCLVKTLGQNEKNRDNIFIKLETIKIFCDGTKWNKGEKIYQDFKQLIRLRNDITHPRSKMIEHGTIQRADNLKYFYNQKKTNFLKDTHCEQSWLSSIETILFSKWCVNTFQEMMKMLLEIMVNCTKLHEKTVSGGRTFTSTYASHYLKKYNFKVIVLT